MTDNPVERQRSILVFIADLHTNSKYGILSPETIITEEDAEGNLVPHAVDLNPLQKQLWSWYSSDVQRVIEWADKSPIDLLVVGDISQGTFFKRGLVSVRDADTYEMAFQVLVPWLSNIRRLRLVKGTEVHEQGEGSVPENLVSRIRGSYPSIDVTAPYHSKISIADTIIDVAHHGPTPGSRNWLRGNVLRLYIQDIMDAALKNGEMPPSLVVRAHYHTYTSEIVTRRTRNRMFRTAGVILPSYSGIDPHARKIAQSRDSIDIGLVAYEVVDGIILWQLDTVRTLDVRTREEWK